MILQSIEDLSTDSTSEHWCNKFPTFRTEGIRPFALIYYVHYHSGIDKFHLVKNWIEPDDGKARLWTVFQTQLTALELALILADISALSRLYSAQDNSALQPLTNYQGFLEYVNEPLCYKEKEGFLNMVTEAFYAAMEAEMMTQDEKLAVGGIISMAVENNGLGFVDEKFFKYFVLRLHGYEHVAATNHKSLEST